jgi:putative transposase
MGNDIDSLAHTKWRCQYHIVFAPKYRRKAIYGKYKAAAGLIPLREYQQAVTSLICCGSSEAL